MSGFFGARNLIIACLLATAISAQAQTGVTGDTILIGTSLNMTGADPDRALEIKRASDMVFANVNSKGGIHGRKIKVIAYDDGYVPKRALENAEKLIKSDKVF